MIGCCSSQTKGLPSSSSTCCVLQDKNTKPSNKHSLPAILQPVAPKRQMPFTKKHMEQAAHQALDAYFAANIDKIERWFNVISPEAGTLQKLKHILVTLKNKDWRVIL